MPDTPPTGVPALLKAIEQWEHARDELRAVIREAHTATKDARAAKRDLEAAVQQAINDAKSMVDNAVAEHLAIIGPKVKETVEAMDVKIHKRFDELTNLMLTGDKHGHGEHIIDTYKKTRGFRPT